MTMFICMILGVAGGLWLGLRPEGWRNLVTHDRLLVLLACILVYLFRQVPVFFLFLRRKVGWFEAATISIIMSLVIGLIVYLTAGSDPRLSAWAFIGVLVYLFGSSLHTATEWSRYRFKQDPANSDRLYTRGLARFGQNMNYTGDLILFTGLAMVSGIASLLFVPLGMLVNFVFFILPEKERYLVGHYPEEWPEYSARTKRLIPWIY